MSNISKTEFIDNIHDIISEGLNPTSLDNSKKFGIRKYVISLIESGQRNPKLMTYLNQYNDLLSNKSVKEYMIYEKFGHGLAEYSTGNKEVKAVIKQMNENLVENGYILEAYKLIEAIRDPQAKSIIKECYDCYIADKDFTSQNNLIDALTTLQEAGDPAATQLIVIIANGNGVPQIELGTTASKFDEIEQRLRDAKKQRQIEDIKNQVDAYAEKIFNKSAEEEAKRQQQEKAECCFDGCINKCGLDLAAAIKAIANSDAKSNARLMATLDEYAGAINQGAYEERLYESFVHNMSQFNYFLPVEKQLKRINEVAEKNKISIDVMKLLEEMSSTNSYYLIPVIEEDVCRFVKNPNDSNRAQAKMILCQYASDPYCHAIIEAIDKNYIYGKGVDDLVLSFKDKVEVIKENASIKSIYSPIQYIKEGECVFNANGQYFVKKGNNLATINEEYLPQLSENFVALCQLVNDPRVTINDDHIVLIGNNKIANIYEGYADINGNRETADKLRNLSEMSMRYDFDNNFFIMTSCLLENFNKIAKVDFAKHIELNENAGLNVDIFRLNGNIFINAINEDLNQETFYQNVNPIQCKNIINNHMGMNVSALFEDLLPSQDKFLMKLNEAKDGYEKAIGKYESTIVKLKNALNDCKNEDNAKKLKETIASAEEKLEDVKKEYKEWQAEVEKQTTGKSKEEKTDDSEDDNIEKEPQTKPISAKEVEDVKDELIQPLTAETTPVDGEMTTEEDPIISDEEFDAFFDKTNSADGDEDIIKDNPEVAPEIEEPADGVETPNSDETLPNDAPEGDDILPNDAPEGDDIFDQPDVQPENPIEPTDNPDDGFNEVTFDENEETDEQSPIEGADSETETEENPIEDEISFNDGDDIEPIEAIATPETAVPEGYKIANIAFDQNIKTGEIYKSGSAIIITPKVDAAGNMYVESKTYNFYLGEDNKPIIDAEDIPVALYNVLANSIIAEPQYEAACASKDISPIQTENEKTSDYDIEDLKQDNKDNIQTYYPAKEINQISDELNKSDETDFFEIDDLPDQLIIQPKDDINFEEGEPENSKTPFEEDSEECPQPSKKSPFEEDSEEEKIDIFKDNAIQNIGDIFSDIEEEPDEEPENDDLEDFTDEDFDDDDETEKPEGVLIPTYKSEDGKTDIELPAPGVDGSEIKESKKMPKNKSLNEKIVGIKSFFVSEGTAKPSKKEVAHVNESNLDGIDNNIEAPEYEPYENYDPSLDSDTLEVMKTAAEDAIAASNVKDVEVSEITSPRELTDKGISMKMFTLSNPQESYAIYKLGEDIYYRPETEIIEILKDGEGEVPEYTRAMLISTFSDPDVPMDYVEEKNYEDCMFLIKVLLQSFGINYSLNESIKIRRPKLGTGGDINKSKKVDDIKNGTKEDKDFREEIENKSLTAGVDNPMLAPKQESVQQILPNVHNQLQESRSLEDLGLKPEDIIYEPMDKVVIKATGMKALVVNIMDDEEGNIKMLTVVASNGDSFQCSVDAIEPDPLYLENIPGRLVNSQIMGMPKYSDYNIDPKTRMPKPLENDTAGECKDLNGKYVPVYITVNGVRITLNPDLAFAADIAKSKKNIRVMNEKREIQTYNVNENLEFADMPYAVIVDSENRPVRRIKVNPVSYINASEEDLVECSVGDKMTKYPKSKIKILS